MKISLTLPLLGLAFLLFTNQSSGLPLLARPSNFQSLEDANLIEDFTRFSSLAKRHDREKDEGKGHKKHKSPVMYDPVLRKYFQGNDGMMNSRNEWVRSPIKGFKFIHG